jgi:hypothetical protein
MNWPVALRAGALQALLIFGVSLALGSLLERDFFVSWGWLAGPGAWIACGLAVGALLRLSWTGVLAGAALSGLPSLIAVFAGVHWAGIPLAVVAFAAWCGWLAARGRRRRRREEVPPGGIEPPLPA